MNEPSLTTPVYRYNKYGVWLLLFYCLITLGFFIFSFVLPPIGTGIYVLVLVILPVYAGLKQKSIFSIRWWDKKPLTISSNFIEWDGKKFMTGEIEELSIYIFSFENFRHPQAGSSSRNSLVREYGNKNTLSFKQSGLKYDFTFFLADFTAYDILYRIIGTWQGVGIPLKARSAFDDAYIRKEMAMYGG